MAESTRGRHYAAPGALQAGGAHLRRLCGRRRQGTGAGDHDGHERHRGRRFRGQDRRLRHARLRGAARLWRPCSHRRVRLGDLGGARVGPRRDPPLRQGRILCRRSGAVQAEGGVGHIPNVPDIVKIVLAVPSKQLLGDIAAASTGRRSARARAPTASASPGGAGAAPGVPGGGDDPDIKAAVAWYGATARPFPTRRNPVSGFDVAKDIKMPFLGLYGEPDQNPKPEDVKKFEEMVKQVNKSAEFVIYPGVGHAFFADYRPSYNAAAAADAWKRCTGLLDKTLKA